MVKKKEFFCDFVANISITEIPEGHDCSAFISGSLNTAGILSALDALKTAEEQLSSRLPVPRDIIEKILKEKRAEQPKPNDPDLEQALEILKPLIKYVQKEFPSNRSLDL